MHALRRHKLRQLLEQKYSGDRGRFLADSGLTKGRLSQLLKDGEPFGDTAARNLEERLRLDPGYFDTMDARTVAFALQFEALPPDVKARWEQLVEVLNRPANL